MGKGHLWAKPNLPLDLQSRENRKQDRSPHRFVHLSCSCAEKWGRMEYDLWQKMDKTPCSSSSWIYFGCAILLLSDSVCLVVLIVGAVNCAGETLRSSDSGKSSWVRYRKTCNSDASLHWKSMLWYYLIPGKSGKAQEFGDTWRHFHTFSHFPNWTWSPFPPFPSASKPSNTPGFNQGPPVGAAAARWCQVGSGPPIAPSLRSTMEVDR